MVMFKIVSSLLTHWAIFFVLQLPTGALAVAKLSQSFTQVPQKNLFASLQVVPSLLFSLHCEDCFGAFLSSMFLRADWRQLFRLIAQIHHPPSMFRFYTSHICSNCRQVTWTHWIYHPLNEDNNDYFFLFSVELCTPDEPIY